MRFIRVIYHAARADFLERTRRYGFLAMMGLVLFLGYQTVIGNFTVQLGAYRGAVNSAWVGGMMTLIAVFTIGWFGFYIVAGSIKRDRETGVGEIVAATPISRATYLLGKWVSASAVLMAMVFVLMLAGILIQTLQHDTPINYYAYLMPFLIIVIPAMTMIAAVAVLFESISFLSGGCGGILFFFLFLFVIAVGALPFFNDLGIALILRGMMDSAKQTHPDYNGDFTLGTTDEEIIGSFIWHGVDWTPVSILSNLSIILFAVMIVLAAALFFDRFDSSQRKLNRMKRSASFSSHKVDSISQTFSTLGYSSTTPPAFRFGFMRTTFAEIKLLLNGRHWVWYAAETVFILACLFNGATFTRQVLLPLAWILPILIWSSIGNRESRWNTGQMVFSSQFPIWRQIPSQWLAGFVFALLTGSGALLRFLFEQNLEAALALFSGAVFIPSLALACGAASGSNKLFEILYLFIWYLGPINGSPELDFVGAISDGRPMFFLPLSFGLILLAMLGRWRKLSHG